MSLPLGNFVTKDKGEWPAILKEPLREMLSPKPGESKTFQTFKEELVLSAIRPWSPKELGAPGAVAVAIKMCDNPKFYNYMKEALNERERSGYKEELNSLIYSLSTCDIFKFHSILSELSGKKLPKDGISYAYVPRKLEKIEYSDLKRLAESQLVKKELAALNALFEKYPEEFKKKLSQSTLHHDITGPTNAKTAKFIMDFLKIVKEKKLYGGEFKLADIGTASGEFSGEAVKFVKQNFPENKVVRTNHLKFEGTPRDVTIHDITKAPLGEKFDMIIIKDVMKFFTAAGKDTIWANINKDAGEGSLVVSGSAGRLKPHVKFNGELVEVDPAKFLDQLGKVKDYRDYLKNLGEIVGNSA